MKKFLIKAAKAAGWGALIGTCLALALVEMALPFAKLAWFLGHAGR